MAGNRQCRASVPRLWRDSGQMLYEYIAWKVGSGTAACVVGSQLVLLHGYMQWRLPGVSRALLFNGASRKQQKVHTSLGSVAAALRRTCQRAERWTGGSFLTNPRLHSACACMLRASQTISTIHCDAEHDIAKARSLCNASLQRYVWHCASAWETCRVRTERSACAPAEPATSHRVCNKLA